MSKIFSLIKRIFCKHEYITEKSVAYRELKSEEALLTATEFHCRCKKCGKKRVFSSKWW